jgi:hypothetical protein
MQTTIRRNWGLITTCLQEKAMYFLLRYCLLWTTVFYTVSLCNQCTRIIIIPGMACLVKLYIMILKVSVLFQDLNGDLNALMFCKAMQQSCLKLMHSDLNSHLIIQRNIFWLFHLHQMKWYEKPSNTLRYFSWITLQETTNRRENSFSLWFVTHQENAICPMWQWYHQVRHEW